jgi:hypothetical protein
LPPFINGPIAVDLCHISSVVLGEGLKALAEHGEGWGSSSEGREEPCWKSSWCLVFPPSVREGVEFGDNREVGGGIPVHVPSHSSPIHGHHILSQQGRSKLTCPRFSMYPLGRSTNGCWVMGGWSAAKEPAHSSATHCSSSSSLCMWLKLLCPLKARTRLLMSSHRRSGSRLASA